MHFFFYRLLIVRRRKVVMNNSLSGRLPRLKEPGSALQLLASITLVFLLAFGADVLLQRAIELFVAGVVEQDAFAQNILALITLVSFLALGVGFVATLVFFFIPFSGRSRSPQPFQSGAKRLLK